MESVTCRYISWMSDYDVCFVTGCLILEARWMMKHLWDPTTTIYTHFWGGKKVDRRISNFVPPLHVLISLQSICHRKTRNLLKLSFFFSGFCRNWKYIIKGLHSAITCAPMACFHTFSPNNEEMKVKGIHAKINNLGVWIEQSRVCVCYYSL